jgi:hypothetical protein
MKEVVMDNDLPPSPEDFKVAVRRIELGTATYADANIIREYVGMMEDGIEHFVAELKKERANALKFDRDLNEALNMGKGIYKP